MCLYDIYIYVILWICKYNSMLHPSNCCRSLSTPPCQTIKPRAPDLSATSPATHMGYWRANSTRTAAEYGGFLKWGIPLNHPIWSDFPLQTIHFDDPPCTETPEGWEVRKSRTPTVGSQRYLDRRFSFGSKTVVRPRSPAWSIPESQHSQLTLCANNIKYPLVN